MNNSRKTLRLRYDRPATNSSEGWERESLPIGNGYFGASIFGDPQEERIVISTNELENDFRRGGMTSFAEIHLTSPFSSYEHYERSLCLNRGIVSSSFTTKNQKIHRISFFNYPSNVFVYRVDSSEPISLSATLVIPYLGERSKEDGGREGEVVVEENTLRMHGKLFCHEILFEGRLFVESDGQVTFKDNSIQIASAKKAIFYFVAGTNYQFDPAVFLDPLHRASGPNPKIEVEERVKEIREKGYESLYQEHLEDFQNLMDRVTLDFGGKEDGRTVPELMESYRKGKREPYLEELYFQYGRYLLISSSREKTTPPSLQGVWTVYDRSPWGSGFWHNINVQMNFWPAFTTNLAECFQGYLNLWRAYLPRAQKNAKAALDWIAPEKNVKDAGWIVGTGVFCYEAEGISSSGHSGPGTGGMTSLIFADAYRFTKDKAFLATDGFEAVHGMEKFFVQSVKQYGTSYLARFSASPEQMLSGHWENDVAKQPYYHSIGTTFDQSFLYQNAMDDLAFAEELGVEDETTKKARQQIKHYEPVRIGYSGQIKEYGEEHFYGEIGEYHHRHLSQLVGLMPASFINHETPAWLDAARLTLTERGDESTGWALAHRLCCWARIGDGDHAYLLWSKMLREKTFPNLWDVHPPFQIDGNFGATAGVAEMLLQSHEGYLSFLPACPSAWSSFEAKGLCAREGFVVSLKKEKGTLTEIVLQSKAGEEAKLFFPAKAKIKVFEDGKLISVTHHGRLWSFPTKKGSLYVIHGEHLEEKTPNLPSLKATYHHKGVLLRWSDTKQVYRVYRAENSDSTYRFLGYGKKGMFWDGEYSSSHRGRLTYKIVPQKAGASMCDQGSLAVLDPASDLERDRYRFRLEVNNLNPEKIG